MVNTTKIAVVGAGLIGKSHAKVIRDAAGIELACIVDPSGDGQAFAKSIDAVCYASIGDMFAHARVDGVVLATPNQHHITGALACIAAGCPVLVEKPLCVTVAEAEKLVDAAQAAGVAVLTGHHRRHGATLGKAKEIIDQGLLGDVVTVQGTCWFYKPDSYFGADWRGSPGGGPVFINLIHDINTMLMLFGDVQSVQALQSSRIRGGQVEDTAAIMVRFYSGVLGTISVSDTVASPWSWELTSGENPVYPATSQSSYLIGGTKGSLSIPDLTLWQHEGRPDWRNPIRQEQFTPQVDDPLRAQIHQFAAVIRGEQDPLVSALDGLRTLRVIEAVKQSAANGQMVTLGRS